MTYSDKMSDKIPSFTLEEYDVIRHIGEGGFATVRLAKNKATDELVALKVYKFAHENDVKSEADFIREIGFMSTVSHPCIIKFKGVLEYDSAGPPTFAYALEYLEHGSMQDILDKIYYDGDNVPFGPTERSIVMFGVASAMKYLHMQARTSGAVMHRDLKSGNIMLDANYRPRIGDFGFAKLQRRRNKRLNDTNTERRGSWPWMAPEVMNGGKYGTPADVFSFAMVLYELATNMTPFVGFKTGLEYVQAVSEREDRPGFPDSESAVKNLAVRCWQQNPDERLTFEEIVEELKTGAFLFEGTDTAAFGEFVRSIGE